MSLLKVLQVVVHVVLVAGLRWLLKRIGSDTVTANKVPLANEAVNVDSKHTSCLQAEEAAYEASLCTRKDAVRAFVEASDLLLWIHLNLWKLFVVKDVLYNFHAVNHLVCWVNYLILNLCKFVFALPSCN